MTSDHIQLNVLTANPEFAAFSRQFYNFILYS